jgi:hypothetical protein
MSDKTASKFITDNLYTFWVDGLKYYAKTKPTGELEVTIPEQKRLFVVGNIYLDNPDFPLIQDGKFDDKLRAFLQRKGFDLPEVPYRVGLSISNK